MPNLASQLVKKLKSLGNIFLQNSEKSNVSGSQRSVAYASSVRRDYDLELQEYPVRDAALGRDLIEMVQYCYEARHCLSMAAGDAFSSSDGDDVGWTIASTLDDNETPIHPDVKAIALDLINRKQSHEEYVLGGLKLQRVLRTMLAYGDAFLSLGIEKDGNGYTIARGVLLPTWEMFRIEDDAGRLEGFEQRRSVSGEAEYFLYPPQCVHFRNERRFLYGESIFRQSLVAWQNLKDATRALNKAALDLGMNPNLHLLPEGVTPEQKAQYEFRHQADKSQGMITDLYLYSGQDIRKISNVNPSLKPLIDNLLQQRYRVIPPGFPVWFFPGLHTTGAREIRGEPARKYARMRNSWCALLTQGINQMVDTEIILRKGYDWFKEHGRYRVIWSKWIVSQSGYDLDEANVSGIVDLD